MHEDPFLMELATGDDLAEQRCLTSLQYSLLRRRTLRRVSKATSYEVSTEGKRKHLLGRSL